MLTFQVLCPTMRQTDFSLAERMHLNSDALFANQSDRVDSSESVYNGHTLRMITSDTIGVGANRNLLLLYANADICLMADDDIEYVDDYQEIVLSAFENNPQADMIIFNITSDTAERTPAQIKKKYRLTDLRPNPFGGPRIAFRLASIRAHNLWFSLLFGGGAPFPSGEDTKFILDAIRAGLKVYCVPEFIGKTSCSQSSWYSGFDEKMYTGKGAFFAAAYPRTKYLRFLLFAWRTGVRTDLGFIERIRLMKRGAEQFKKYHVGKEFS